MSIEIVILIFIAGYFIANIFLDDSKNDRQQKSENYTKSQKPSKNLESMYSEISKIREERKLERRKKSQIKIENQKSYEEIGAEYEMFVGHLYENRGFEVIYHGILKGMEDRGIDLICKRGKLIHLVQCKRWSNRNHATIDENLIRKLAKSARDFPINSNAFIQPVFYSTVPFESQAEKVAEDLGIFCRGSRKHEWMLRDWLKKSGWTVESFKQNLEVKS